MGLCEILMNVPDIHETEEQENPIAHLKFQNLLGKGTWYVTEMGATEDDDVLMFGYVISPLGDDCNEWGYFTLSQLLQLEVIWLDSSFKPQPIKELIA